MTPRQAFSVSAALFASAPAFVQAVPIAGTGTWETTLQARDLDGNGMADAFYDTDLKITWLGDARAARGTAYADSAGRATFTNAVAWTASLTLAGGGWRLPKVLGSALLYVSGSSELAHLYTFTLGNTTQHFPDLPIVSGFANTADFVNAVNGFYWLAPSPYPNESRTSFFADTVSGFDGYTQPMGSSTLAAWAVHDGDVGTPLAGVAAVPEASTWALLAGGLAAVGFSRRRATAASKAGPALPVR